MDTARRNMHKVYMCCPVYPKVVSSNECLLPWTTWSATKKSKEEVQDPRVRYKGIKRYWDGSKTQTSVTAEQVESNHVLITAAQWRRAWLSLLLGNAREFHCNRLPASILLGLSAHKRTRTWTYIDVQNS